MKNIKINDIQSLSHTTSSCKYRIVFATKYSRKVFYEEKKIRNGINIKKTMRIERHNNYWSRGMSRLYTYVSKNTTQI